MKLLMLLLLLVAGVFGYAYVQHARHHATPAGEKQAGSSGGVENAPASGSIYGSITKVDFRNFTYQPGCISEGGANRKSVTTRNGKFDLNSDKDKLDFTVSSVAYGDLTGDGRDEAAILTSCNTGGSGVFDEGLVYGLKNGRAVVLARTETGDRAYGGIRGLKIKGEELIIERYATDKGGPMCCPKYLETAHYRLKGAKLEKTGTASRRRLPAS